ncbi:MAG: hypothetical protein CMN30_07805 [Sandaracinus sp.]|nr:hypothetical protein [Sandaracinus sp.]
MDEEWRRWFVPGVVPVTLLEIAEERGVDVDGLLERAGIATPRAEIFETGVTMGQHAEVLAAIHGELRDPRLGFELGWRLPPTALGSVGYAILASANLGEALELLQRFWHLIGRATAIVVDTAGEVGSVTLDLRVSAERWVDTFVKETTMVSMVRGATAMMPAGPENLEVWFDFAEPDHGDYVRERLPRVRWDMPTTQMRFPVHLLERKLAMSNPVGLRAAVKWCEREERMRGMADGRVTARVQSDLQPGPSGYPSLEQTARKLGMAPRTLRRHLKDEGTGFSELLEGARRRDAMRLLDNPDLAAHEVATMLGYVDAANFTRAFRRWTGRTPTQYRAQAASER